MKFCNLGDRIIKLDAVVSVTETANLKEDINFRTGAVKKKLDKDIPIKVDVLLGSGHAITLVGKKADEFLIDFREFCGVG